MARFTFAALVAAFALAHSAWADCPLGSTLDTSGTICVCDAGSVGPGYTTTATEWDTGFCAGTLIARLYASFLYRDGKVAKRVFPESLCDFLH
jgi:hypothetical protein